MADDQGPQFPSCRRHTGAGSGESRHGCPRFGVPSSVGIHIGKRLQRLRSESGLSRETLAVGVGSTVSRVTAHERGIDRIGPCDLIRYAEFLGVRLSAFFK